MILLLITGYFISGFYCINSVDIAFLTLKFLTLTRVHIIIMLLYLQKLQYTSDLLLRNQQNCGMNLDQEGRPRGMGMSPRGGGGGDPREPRMNPNHRG